MRWRGAAVKRAMAGALGVALLAVAGPSARAQGQLDLALVLAVDCSYSVDAHEFELQMQGLAKAFLDPGVVEAIGVGKHGAIAVSIVQWSSAKSQVLVLPWTVVRDTASAAQVAETLLTAPRMTQDGGTSISAMIDVGAALLARMPLPAARHVIDISSDGRNNNGRDVRRARDAAVAQGVTINGLAILNEVPTLHFYFERWVIGGADAFVVKANDYDDYVNAIRRKLLREIGGDKFADAGGTARGRTATP
jgi:Protein of unknown function (DUF1194)